jgi:predicted SAM-dependent methyltransferase
MRILKNVIRRIINLDVVFGLIEGASFQVHKKEIAGYQARNSLKLHLGCGPRILPGWINSDMELRRSVLAQKLPRGLKRFETDSVRYIYASHFLEHLDYPEDALAFGKECYRVLVPGGTLRIVVPGIEKIIRAYAADDEDFFKTQAEMHPADCTTKLEHLMYALQQEGQHKYGYDFKTMEKLLTRAGFNKVCLSSHNGSSEDELRIEYRGKQDESGEYVSLYVEAVKS